MNFDKIVPVLEVLNRFAARSTEFRDIRELAMEVEHILEELIDMEYTGLFLFDFVDKKLKLYFARGFSEEERLESERTAMERHPGHVFRTGKTLHVPDVEKDNPSISIDSKRSFKVRSRLTIPVFHGEKVVGMFGMASSEPNKFTEEQIQIFTFIGNIAGSVYGHILNRHELQKLALIARNTDNAVMIADREGRVEWVNDAFERTTGYALGDITGKKMLETMHLKNPGKGKTPGFLKDFGARNSIETNTRLYTSSGKPYWAWIQVRKVFNETGDLAQIISIHRDFSERKKMEDAVKENARQTKMIIDTALDAYIMIDSLGRVIRWNRQAARMFGYSFREVKRKKISDLIIPDHMKERHVKGLKRFMETDISAWINRRIEVTAKRKTGEHFVVELAVNPVKVRNESYFSAFIKDISEQKKAQYELESTSSRITTLMQNLHSGILVENEYREIVLVNKEFCHLFGIDSEPEELVGLDCRLAMDKVKSLFRDPAAFIGRSNELILSRKLAVEETLELEDGRIFDRDYLPIFSNGKFMGNLWQYADITPRKKAEDELRAARQEAVAASIAKSQFLANMSHEIRTPLNAINGLIRLLEDTPVSKEQKKLLAGLDSSSEGLLAIVNDVLDFTKIEAGQMELIESEFSLSEMVNKVIGAFEFKAAEKEVKLRLIYDDRIRGHLFGDNVRLRQILINLLNNAIKFTQKGSVTLECSRIAETDDTCSVLFRVTDTGIGIARENLTRIFQSFQQVDTGTTRSFGGTGLGLAISKQLVELMGGELGVNSEKDRGSEFFFTLKFKNVQAPVPDKKTESSVLNLETLKGIQVLLVEDNQFNQFIARSMLEKWKMVVTVASNGREAIDILAREQFSVILMDLQMPEMGGLEATRLLRSEMKLATPIVALTANAVKGVIEECLDAGMNDYIPKPFHPETLAAKIIALITPRG